MEYKELGAPSVLVCMSLISTNTILTLLPLACASHQLRTKLLPGTTFNNSVISKTIIPNHQWINFKDFDIISEP